MGGSMGSLVVVYVERLVRSPMGSLVEGLVGVMWGVL